MGFDQTEDIDDGSINIEVILQKIFNETDPVAHRAAIWELFQLSGDWELFEQLQEFGGAKGILNYFQNVMEQLDEAVSTDEDEIEQPLNIPIEHREAIRELYSNPITCIRQGDWAGMAAAIHEVLLTEIYDVFEISEEKLPFGEATSSLMSEFIGEEILFPLSIIEYMAFSDCMRSVKSPELLENHLALILTLFFSAQAHLDIEETVKGSDSESEDDDLWKD